MGSERNDEVGHEGIGRLYRGGKALKLRAMSFACICIHRIPNANRSASLNN